MKKIIFLLIGVFLSGCVSTADRARQQDEIDKTIPVCGSAKQCEAAWSGARQWVTRNCGMKIQTYSNDYIETYNAIGNSPSTACQVTKNPLPNGLFSINIMVTCSNMFGCVPDQFESVIKFNKEINENIKNFAPVKIGVLWGMSDKNGVLVNASSESFGLLIKSLENEGSAKRNGLKEKDIVTHIDNKRVTKLSDYGDVMDAHAVGEKITFTVFRHGESMVIPFRI